MLGLRLLFLLAASRLTEHGSDNTLYSGSVDDVVGFGPPASDSLHHAQLQLPDGVRVIRRRWRNGPFANLLCQSRNICGVERNLQGAHLVQNATHGPNVGWPRVGLLLYNLRAKVVRRADKSPCKGRSTRHYLGDAKIAQPDVATFRQEDVAWLKVPMQDVLAMQVFQRQGSLCEPPQDLQLRKGLPLFPRSFNLSCEVPSVTKVHDDAEPATLREVFPVPDDVRVLHL
mmetsp:Transcript_45584/g.114903  ORF Transcript_45584/g.114903 Transcript_45584/m.114903 type:complete len:229 (+) Transcript_45584:2060-2746(+)